MCKVLMSGHVFTGLLCLLTEESQVSLYYTVHTKRVCFKTFDTMHLESE